VSRWRQQSERWREKKGEPRGLPLHAALGYPQGTRVATGSR